MGRWNPTAAGTADTSAEPRLAVGASRCPGCSVTVQVPGPGISIIKRLPGDSDACPLLGTQAEATHSAGPSPRGRGGRAWGPSWSMRPPGCYLWTSWEGTQKGARGQRSECAWLYMCPRECDATSVNPGVRAGVCTVVTMLSHGCGCQKVGVCLCACVHVVCVHCVCSSCTRPHLGVVAVGASLSPGSCV